MYRGLNITMEDDNLLIYWDSFILGSPKFLKISIVYYYLMNFANVNGINECVLSS